MEFNLANIEYIEPYAIAPWLKRVTLITGEVGRGDALVVTSTSARNGLIGVGYGVYTSGWTIGQGKWLAQGKDQSPYSAELFAIAEGLQLLNWANNQVITIESSCLSALQSIQNPKQQSGQQYLKSIYAIAERIGRQGCRIQARWVSSANQKIWNRTAKAYAKTYTKLPQADSTPADKLSVRTSVREYIKRLLPGQDKLPETVGRHIKEVDSVLPGKHIKQIYDILPKRSAKILAQLRTGMARLNSYLNTIKATESEKCDYCGSKETVKHFLFQCSQWRDQREQMLQVANSRWGDLSYFLGGKSSQKDDDKWKPNVAAIKATIRYAINTKRLDPVADMDL